MFRGFQKKVKYGPKNEHHCYEIGKNGVTDIQGCGSGFLIAYREMNKFIVINDSKEREFEWV